MIFPEKVELFTVKELSRVCGVSRATLLRMEESGFLKPYRIDPDTGYRYYDAQNITAVGQYQRLQAIGLSRREITDLYYERVDWKAFLKTQREKLALMQTALDEFELRHDSTKNHTFSYVSLPAVTYYCTFVSAPSLEALATVAYVAYGKCVRAGYRIIGAEPLAVMYDNRDSCLNPLSGITLGFPVIPGPEPDPNLRSLPATEAFSLLGFGTPDATEHWRLLFGEIEARGLEPSGLPRLNSLVAPYSGLHYRTDEFCHQCLIPIKGRKG